MPYVHLKKPISGNFTIVYTIEEHTIVPPTAWSKCGVMVAQELDMATRILELKESWVNLHVLS